MRPKRDKLLDQLFDTVQLANIQNRELLDMLRKLTKAADKVCTLVSIDGTMRVHQADRIFKCLWDPLQEAQKLVKEIEG